MPERSTYRGIRRRPGTESSWIAAAAVLAVLVIPGGVALAHSPRPAASAAQVLMIYQSPQNITEHDALTVSMHLASSSSVQQVYFTFCQLTSALCYLPVPMDAIGSNWYRGTTGPMSGYHGMDPGVVGGYNITIVYSDNSTSAAPILPNPFSNLTVVQSVTGENMYRMAVMSLVYDVSGHVVERASGAPVVGADVTLSAGNVSSTTTNSLGVYTFTNVTAGNYTLAVSRAGYEPSSAPLQVADRSLIANVTLTNSTRPPHPTNGTPSGWASFLGSPLGEAVLGIATVAIVAAVVVALRRPRHPTIGRNLTEATAGPTLPSPPPETR